MDAVDWGDEEFFDQLPEFSRETHICVKAPSNWAEAHGRVQTAEPCL
jgi:hypothetical protein